MDKNGDTCRHAATEQPILWAPWRITYVAAGERTQGCIFCEKPARQQDRENLILHRGEHAFVILNRFPYNNGHLMVVPYRHTADFESITLKEAAEMTNLLQRCQRALDDLMHPHGYNIGINIGAAAGAGIHDHLHYHLVPRWNGDTNFMAVTSNTTVISEALDATWERLSARLQHEQAQPAPE